MTREDAQVTAAVRAAAAGDELAWNALVQRFTPMLRRVAKGYRLPPHDVDDVVQACWLSLFTSVRDIREPAAVVGWLVTAARRQSLRARQGEVRELLVESPLDENQPAPDCPEAEIVRAERATVLREAVGRLPGRQRELLETMMAAPGRSYAEVSHSLGMPVGSIGPTRERGLDRLRNDEQLVRVLAS